MSPEVTSSSPAIMRKVVLLPQPEGPTKTTNSRSAMSRSIPCTAGVRSNVLTMLRSATCAILLSFRGAGGQAGDVIVHQKRVDDQRRSRAEQRPGHDLSPRVHVAHDPGGKRHREGWQEDDQHPPMVDKLDPRLVMDKGKSFEQRDKEQRVRDQIGQEHAGRQGRRSPELN